MPARQEKLKDRRDKSELKEVGASLENGVIHELIPKGGSGRHARHRRPPSRGCAGDPLEPGCRLRRGRLFRGSRRGP
jgi:hypothetical protein